MTLKWNDRTETQVEWRDGMCIGQIVYLLISFKNLQKLDLYGV